MIQKKKKKSLKNVRIMLEFFKQEIQIIIKTYKGTSKINEIELLRRRNSNFEFLHSRSLELQQQNN